MKYDISTFYTVALWLEFVWETETVGAVDTHLISGKFYPASHKGTLKTWLSAPLGAWILLRWSVCISCFCPAMHCLHSEMVS